MKTEDEFAKWLLEMDQVRFDSVYEGMTSSARTGNLKSLANVFLPGLLEFHNVKDYKFDSLCPGTVKNTKKGALEHGRSKPFFGPWNGHVPSHFLGYGTAMFHHGTAMFHFWNMAVP
jgi:hypothetical protein